MQWMGIPKCSHSCILGNVPISIVYTDICTATYTATYTAIRHSSSNTSTTSTRFRYCFTNG
jgi:hypothetical protein